MRPLRRTILQFSQIRLTLERTFMTGPIVKKRNAKAAKRWMLSLPPARYVAACPLSGRLIAINRPDRPPTADTPSGPRPGLRGIGRLYAKGGVVHKQTRQRICVKSEGLRGY
jgi:hypothetical protein